MAKVQLKIEVNPNAETEKLGDITNKVDGTGTNANLSNVSIKANDRGLYKVGEMNSKGRELLSFGEDGNLVFTQSGYLSSNGKDVGMLASEQNPDMFVWGVVPSNKTYNVKLTFTNAQNLKDIVVYGDRVADQFPTEAIIDNNKVIYNDDYRWAINLLTESDTHTIEFTKWNRGDYNACLTLIRVMLRYFDISKDSGLIEVESLSQSNSQPKDIYYGVIPNTGSARVNDIGGEIKDLIDEGIITNSKNNIEIFIDNQKVQHHITTDSDYEDGKVFTMEFENSLSFLETKYAGRNLTDPMSAYYLLSEVLGTLNFSKIQIDGMLDKEIVYGNNEIGSVKSYLEKITIEYPYLESATYRETLDKFCVLAQLNLLEDDNGNLKFVSARPVETKNTDIIVIPTNKQFAIFRKDEFLKNKYSNVFIGRTNYVGEYQLFGETKSVTFLEEQPNTQQGTLEDGSTYEYSSYKEVYNDKDKNIYADFTTKIQRQSGDLVVDGYKVKGIKLPISNEYIIKDTETLYLNVEMNVKSPATVVNKEGKFQNLVYSFKGTKVLTFTWKLSENYKDGVNYSYIDNINIEKGYVTFDLFCPSLVSGTGYGTHVYPLSVNLQLYGNIYKIENISLGENFDIETDSNELITNENKYENQNLCELHRENIVVDYKKGVRTSNTSVACLDYYDTNGNKVIDWSKQEILKVGQIVRIDKDNLGNSKVNYINGEPYLWKITGRKFRYSGVPMLDLELQECKLNTYFMISETLGDYVVATYTRISSEYGGSIGQISKTDILYPSDVIKVDYTMVDNPVYDLGNAYVNGNQIASGDTITIRDNLNLVVDTHVKEFTISATVGTGATLVLDRISSPYANASLGNVSANDKFYYGDIVNISWILDSGYATDTAYLNGERIYPFNLNQITIISNNTIDINTKVVGYQEIWSGEYTYTFSDLTSNESIIELPTSINTQNGLRLTFDRINLFNVSDNSSADEITNITREIPFTLSSEFGNWWSSKPSITFEYKQLSVETTNQLKTIRIAGNYDGVQYMVGSFKLSKIEQYVG